MNKVLAAKSVLCISAATLLITGAKPYYAGATGICTETSLAGISLSLEQYIGSSGSNVNPADIVTLSTGGTGLEDNSEQEPDTDIQGEEPEETEEPKDVSKYENMGISIANDYVNIRKKPDIESEILGKLYRGAAATIIKRKGDWVKIESGSVTGYINAEYLAIGFDAEELEDMFGTKWATVTTETLFVREKKSTESTILTMIPLGETYEVIKEYDDWVKILVDEGEDGQDSMKGYVSKDYVEISVEFEHAISIEEELAEQRRQEEARKAEEERLRQLEEEKRQKEQQQQQNQNNNSNSNNNNSNSNSNNNNSNSNSNSNSNNNNNNNSNSNSNSGGGDSSDSAPDKSVESGDGAAIAAYAQKFVGNPYVYGGTSLTNGADCSGFVQSVFAHYGISLPRTSSSQATAGRKVSFDNLKAGDLIFYASNGRVNHVALYIGGSQVVHASNRKTGIKISTWNYRTPYTARRVVE